HTARAPTMEQRRPTRRIRNTDKDSAPEVLNPLFSSSLRALSNKILQLSQTKEITTIRPAARIKLSNNFYRFAPNRLRVITSANSPAPESSSSARQAGLALHSELRRQQGAAQHTLVDAIHCCDDCRFAV
ncbi:MAG TPA: hypothetical protein VKQ89_00585, partial [Candidatus Angelobacter sp.]|nr:hypothetical protein [Candidatus Angelobacter sp.]